MDVACRKLRYEMAIFDFSTRVRALLDCLATTHIWSHLDDFVRALEAILWVTAIFFIPSELFQIHFAFSTHLIQLALLRPHLRWIFV